MDSRNLASFCFTANPQLTSLSLIGDKNDPLEVLEYGDMEVKVHGESAVVWSTIQSVVNLRKQREFRSPDFVKKGFHFRYGWGFPFLPRNRLFLRELIRSDLRA
jgi:hypothetical protein